MNEASSGGGNVPVALVAAVGHCGFEKKRTLGHATTDEGLCAGVVRAWCGRDAGALQKGLSVTVHARDINATALRTDDKAMGLASIARVSYLLELKRWYQGPKLCVNQGKQSSRARPGERLDHHLCALRCTRVI